MNKLTQEERLNVLEILVNSLIWGVYLEDRERRYEIAQQLNTTIAAAERHQSLTPNVVNQLKLISDSFVEIDNVADPLRPFLRP